MNAFLEGLSRGNSHLAQSTKEDHMEGDSKNQKALEEERVDVISKICSEVFVRPGL